MADAMNERMDVSGMNEDCFGLVTNRRRRHGVRRGLSVGETNVCVHFITLGQARDVSLCVWLASTGGSLIILLTTCEAMYWSHIHMHRTTGRQISVEWHVVVKTHSVDDRRWWRWWRATETERTGGARVMIRSHKLKSAHGEGDEEAPAHYLGKRILWEAKAKWGETTTQSSDDMSVDSGKRRRRRPWKTRGIWWNFNNSRVRGDCKKSLYERYII